MTQWIIKYITLMIWILKSISMKKSTIFFSQEDVCNTFEVESKQYQRGYQNATDDFQNKLN